MLGVLCDIAERVNKLVDAVKNIQQTIGLVSDNDNSTVLGKLNGLTEVRMVVDEVSVVGDQFVTNSVVKDGVCVGNRVYIDYGDGTEAIYKDINISGNTGELVGANSEFDGLTVTVTYLTESIIGV